MGWGLIQEVPECPVNAITFHLSSPYSGSSKRKDGRERKDEPANDRVHLLSTQGTGVRFYLLLFLSVANRGPHAGKSLRSSSFISSDVQWSRE